jgi:hypothetical protein
MLISPSWQLAPRPLKRMLERLEIEHLRHGGFNNGELFVSYGQFVEAGMSRRSIKPTQQLGADLGLMEVIQNEGAGDIRAPNAYRLTYVPAKGKKNPSDDWKSITEERARTLVEAFKAADKAAAKISKREAA